VTWSQCFNTSDAKPANNSRIDKIPLMVGDGGAAVFRLRLMVDWRTVDEAELNLTT